MPAPPRISAEQMISSVETHYAIRLESLDWFDGGADSHAWVAQGQTRDGRAYVVKLRSGPIDSASIRLAGHLRDQGMPQVVAPLPTAAGGLWAAEDGYTLILYPFIAGLPAAELRLPPEQWTDFGRLVRQLHDQTLPPELAAQIPTERWDTPWLAQVAALGAAVERADPADPVAGEFVGLWRQHRATVERLAGRAEELAARLAAEPAPLVMCHADLHTWNVLVDRDERLRLIDWDTAMFARKERDLMFVVEGISHELVSPEASAWFFAGYGPARLDPAALAYYRCAWAIQDWLSFGDEIVLRPELGTEARRRALSFVTGIFKPGEIVQIALESGAAELRFG